MHSLRARLLVVWLLSLLAAVAAGATMLQLYARSSSIALARADELVSGACDDIRDRYGYYGTGWAGPLPSGTDDRFRRDLAAVLAAALADTAAVRGGIAASDGALLASYPADAPDLPQTREWQAAVAQAAAQGSDVVHHTAGDAETVVIAACPLAAPAPGLLAWASRRVAAPAGAVPLRLGIGALAALVIAIALWLTWLLAAWARHVGGIENALAAHGAGGALPAIPPTGERELDRIVAALNEAAVRLSQAQGEAAEMARRAAHAERLAALGRVAAGLAHEIRNPIAAMRLRAENGIAGPPERRIQALEAVLTQITRLDRLLTSLLSMTQSETPKYQELNLAEFVLGCVDDHADVAVSKGLSISAGAQPAQVRFDPDMIRRAISNLVQNALREGAVRIEGTVDEAAGKVRISVADDGLGVSARMRENLFEPFVTSHADGTGLGLAISRELVAAHGGTIALVPTDRGARFVIELPWRAGADPAPASPA